MPFPDVTRLSDRARVLLVSLVLLVIAGLLSLTIEPAVHAANRNAETKVAAGAQPRRSSVQPFKGLGTWIDIYDTRQWENPERTVRTMARKGVQTLYLQTGNYRIDSAIYKRGKAARFIESAHDRGIKVIAWYLPEFKRLKRDFRRVRAALRFVTPNGHRFDRFALDIESTVVSDIDERNRRMFKLTRRIRNIAGDMALGGITPDPIGSLYWPNFPYARVANRYDVIMPMGYFTYRTSGARGVRKHVAAGISYLRSVIERDRRIHYIGGISGDATFYEVRAYRRVAMERNIMGGGLYDFPGTTRKQWRTLKPMTTLPRR